MEPDYLQDPRFKVVEMTHYMDKTRTPFPYRSFYLPFTFVEEKVRYNPYYLARRVAKKEEVPVEVCVGEDECVLESSKEYLDVEEELFGVCSTNTPHQ